MSESEKHSNEWQELEIKRKSYKLEIVKAIAGIFTPIVLIFLTFQVQSVLKEKESELKSREQILAQKQELYNEIGSNLNKMYVYIIDVGDFRQYEPPEIIQLKRETDRLFFMYKPFWSKETSSHYDTFMRSAFDTYNGSGLRAKIKTSPAQKVAAIENDGGQWNPAWNQHFSGEASPSIKTEYTALVLSFLTDISNSELTQ